VSVALACHDRNGSPWYIDVAGGTPCTVAGCSGADVVWRTLGRAAALAGRGRCAPRADTRLPAAQRRRSGAARRRPGRRVRRVIRRSAAFARLSAYAAGTARNLPRSCPATPPPLRALASTHGRGGRSLGTADRARIGVGYALGDEAGARRGAREGEAVLCGEELQAHVVGAGVGWAWTRAATAASSPHTTSASTQPVAAAVVRSSAVKRCAASCSCSSAAEVAREVQRARSRALWRQPPAQRPLGPSSRAGPECLAGDRRVPASPGRGGPRRTRRPDRASSGRRGQHAVVAAERRRRGVECVELPGHLVHRLGDTCGALT